jgi:hypothetical protein
MEQENTQFVGNLGGYTYIRQQEMSENAGQQEMSENAGQQEMSENAGQQEMSENAGQQEMSENAGQQAISMGDRERKMLKPGNKERMKKWFKRI